VLSLRAHQDRCEGHDDDVLGSYWLDAPRAEQHLVETADACPYCAGPLRRLVVAPGVAIWRVVALERLPVEDRQVAILAIVPAGHQVLSCRPCRQAFTRPVR
jgi:hypothetical protein